MAGNPELMCVAGEASACNVSSGGGDNSPSVAVNGNQLGDNSQAYGMLNLSVTAALPVGDETEDMILLRSILAKANGLVERVNSKFVQDLNASKSINKGLSSRNSTLEKDLKEKVTELENLKEAMEFERLASKEKLKQSTEWNEKVNLEMAALRKQLQDEISFKDKLSQNVTLKESELFEMKNQRDFIASEKAVAENELMHEKNKVIALTDENRKLKERIREMSTELKDEQKRIEQVKETCNVAWGALQNVRAYLAEGKAVRTTTPDATNHLEQAPDDSGLGDSTPEHIPQSPSPSPRKRVLEESLEPVASGRKSPKVARDINSGGESQLVMKRAISKEPPELVQESVKAGPVLSCGPPVLQSSQNYSGGHSRTKESTNGTSPARGRSRVSRSGSGNQNEAAREDPKNTPKNLDGTKKPKKGK